MQSRNIDLSGTSNSTSASANNNNSNGHTKNSQPKSLALDADDYVDVVLRKEINLWFTKNSSPEAGENLCEPTNAHPAKDHP
jgi:hypothetical protein